MVDLDASADAHRLARVVTEVATYLSIDKKGYVGITPRPFTQPPGDLGRAPHRTQLYIARSVHRGTIRTAKAAAIDLLGALGHIDNPTRGGERRDTDGVYYLYVCLRDVLRGCHQQLRATPITPRASSQRRRAARA